MREEHQRQDVVVETTDVFFYIRHPLPHQFLYPLGQLNITREETWALQFDHQSVQTSLIFSCDLNKKMGDKITRKELKDMTKR